MKPWLLLGSLALCVICCVGGYMYGVKSEKNSNAAVQLKQEQEYQRFYAELNERNLQLASQLEQAKNERDAYYQTITQTVDKVVERPVYRAECVDDSGLRVINDALRGRAAAPSGNAHAVP